MSDEKREIKALKLLAEKAATVDKRHSDLAQGFDQVKERLRSLGRVDVDAPSFAADKAAHLRSMGESTALTSDVEHLYREADAVYPDQISVDDLLTAADRRLVDQRVAQHIAEFNARYGLDRWDYAIAGGCGLFAAMIDLLCVQAPAKPSRVYRDKVDGVFNRGVQKAFNTILPPEVSDALANANKIGGADASTIDKLVGAPAGTLAPINHRMRALSHDPVLGFVFGVLDMMQGTCTVVGKDGVKVFKTSQRPPATGVFEALGRMMGHLASDVNAPTSKGKRGMGLPAPFMGILRMFTGVPVGDSDFGKQVEWMYVHGYDFRHFVATSLPVLLMEVVMRACYAAKQTKLAGAPFGQALLDTTPTRMSPRFRIMLALAYGCMAAVNGGRVYISKNIMNVNYAAWMGLVWNGFHAAKWILLDRWAKLWEELELQEVVALERVVGALDELEVRAGRLPLAGR